MRCVAFLLVLVLALLAVDVYLKIKQVQRSQVVLQVKEQELNAARSTKKKAAKRAEEQAAKRAALEAQYKALGASFDSAKYSNARLQAKLSELAAANSSLRSATHFIGRQSCFAAHVSNTHSGYIKFFRPKPPPTSGALR